MTSASRNFDLRNTSLWLREREQHRLQQGQGKRRISFRDVVKLVITDQHRAALKRKIAEGIDRDAIAQYRFSEQELRAIKKKSVRQYYETQNTRLDDWLEVDFLVKSVAEDLIDSMEPDADCDGVAERDAPLQIVGGSIESLLPEEEQIRRRVSIRKSRWAVNLNVLANVLLLIAKVVAVIVNPSSLSVITSLLDSVLDLLCNLIVWTTMKVVQWRVLSLRQRFPVGRRRLEPIGVLVFSIIMILSFAQILQESVARLLSDKNVTAELSFFAIGALVANIVIKGGIWFVCIPIKTTQVQALAQDCKTDVLFNSLSLVFPLVGEKTHVWWFDPVGALLLSLYVIYDWGSTSFLNVIRLSGGAVEERILQKLIFLAYRFSPVVLGIKSLTAYHTGDNIWAEFDLLLDHDLPLHEAHDIAETLQYCAEGLNEIDRAFVTTDYTAIGPTGHSVEASEALAKDHR